MIKFITSILSLLWILLVGTPTSEKPRLEKQPTKEDFKRNLNYWIARNFNFIALAAVLILVILIGLVCYAVVGVSAVESGNYYNHLGGVI